MSTPTPGKSPRALDWGDAAAVRAWAHDVYTQARDAIAAGEDATAPPAARELGRAAARRIIKEARTGLESAFAFAGFEVEK